MSELLAAPRDASFFACSHPGNRGGKYHVIGNNGSSVCGIPLLILEIAIPLGDVYPIERCKRPACRKAFEQAEHD